MKRILLISLAILSLISCGKDNVTYPKLDNTTWQGIYTEPHDKPASGNPDTIEGVMIMTFSSDAKSCVFTTSYECDHLNDTNRFQLKVYKQSAICGNKGKSDIYHFYVEEPQDPLYVGAYNGKQIILSPNNAPAITLYKIAE